MRTRKGPMTRGGQRDGAVEDGPADPAPLGSLSRLQAGLTSPLETRGSRSSLPPLLPVGPSPPWDSAASPDQTCGSLQLRRPRSLLWL